MTGNDYDELPEGWAPETSGKALVIRSPEGVPTLVMESQGPYSVLVEGIFHTPAGSLLIDHAQGWWATSENLPRIHS